MKGIRQYEAVIARIQEAALYAALRARAASTPSLNAEIDRMGEANG